MTKGTPKRDGSGKGTRDNRGRGGCDPPKDKGQRSTTTRRGNRNKR